MNHQQINTVAFHKHLWLIFSNVSWQEHFGSIKIKAWHRIYVIRKLKFQLDGKSLQKIYFSFIRTVLEYADVVWDNCMQYQANELEKKSLQSRLHRNWCNNLVSIEKLLSKVGWDTLSCRRKKNISLFCSIK